MMLYLANAFSLQMVKSLDKCQLQIEKVSISQVINLLEHNKIINAIGHDSTMEAFNNLTGLNLSTNRINLSLGKGDKLIVMQFVGGRPPEGSILNDIDFLMKNVEFFYIVIK